MEQNEEKEIKIVEQEFQSMADNLYKLLEYQEKFFECFLKVKLAFLSFVGVIPNTFNLFYQQSPSRGGVRGGFLKK